METQREIAEKYMPVFWMDEKEPFSIDALGYTIFTEDERSDSFPKRCLSADWSRIDCLIEYAVWFDYDIQHLYELEHVWVYVGKDERIEKVEGSFHGKYLNQVRLDTGEALLDEKGRAMVYLQPGKHAVVPDPRIVRLIPGWKESCMELAGIDGLLIQDMFKEKLPYENNEDVQDRVRSYIKNTYAFVPSMKFRPFEPPASLLMPWQELKESIPARIESELKKIKNKAKAEGERL